MNYYYSAQPFLAWVLNEYFYSGAHYVYVAPFLPYRLMNPKSSNPYEIYADLFKPWRDNDIYDAFIAQKRIGLRKGVQAMHSSGSIVDSDRDMLEEVCDKVSLKFFCPIVYRTDIDTIASARLDQQGSAHAGSDEYLIHDLQHHEFDILFFDYRDDAELVELFEGPADTHSVLKTLQNNYVSAS